MPWYAATYPRQHAGGPSGLLGALRALLGAALLHWSVRDVPSGASEAVLHLAEAPGTLEVEGLAPVWAECSKEEALLEATRHCAPDSHLPQDRTVAYAGRLGVAMSVHATSTRHRERRVRFGSEADTGRGSIAPGIYLTATPPVTAGCTAVAVRAWMEFNIPKTRDGKREYYTPSGFYGADFYVADVNLMEELRDIWIWAKEYPSAIRMERFVDRATLVIYEFRLYLTVCGAEYPRGTFENWTDSGHERKFERGARGLTRSELDALWKAWMQNSTTFNPWERNEIVDATGECRHTSGDVTVDRAQDGSYVLIANFDLSSIPIGQIIRRIGDGGRPGRDVLAICLKTPPNVSSEYVYVAKSSDVSANTKGATRGIVTCKRQNSRIPVGTIPWFD